MLFEYPGHIFYTQGGGDPESWKSEKVEKLKFLTFLFFFALAVAGVTWKC